MAERPDRNWREEEVLKQLRQCILCPACGVLVATEAGIKSHTQWHQGITDTVNAIDQKFQQIDTYVRGEGGLESQIINKFNQTDQATAQLRTDATNAINQLRNDATAAINSLNQRVTALEQA